MLILNKAYYIIKVMFAKKLFIKICAVFAVMFVFLSACSSGNELHFTAFNSTPVIVQSRNKPISDAVKTRIENLLDELNAEFSATVKNSTVYKINSAAKDERIAISERFKEITAVLTEMCDFTEGKFDVSVYPLTLLWQFAPSFPVARFTVPTADEINAALNVCGLDKFIFDDYAVKNTDGAKIDFGGALKGYAADEIAKILVEDGINSGYVNVGGSSLNILSVDNLSIVHPRKNGNILSVKIKEKDMSVSTSGDYEKTYTSNGKTYSHIINPANGYPISGGASSATVIGKNGLKLDALSTAICVCSHDFDDPENSELYKFIQKILSSEDFKNAQVFAVCISGDNKQILTNKKQGEDFTLLDNDYTVITVN